MIQLFRPYIPEDAIQAAVDVLHTGWIGLGPKTAEFEKKFAEYVGAKYAVALNSATSALHLAMIVSGVEEGDEVLTTALTFVSTNHAILYQKGVPVFVDVEEGTLNLDLEKAEKLVTSKTKAIVAVHYGGNPLDLEKLYSFAKKHNLAVIEDAAHACGAEYKGKKIGSFGLTSFSFHAVKNLPISDGGMLTTNDEEVFNKLMKLRWMGIDQSTFTRSTGMYKWEYDVVEAGFKYHANDVFSAIGLTNLTHLDEWNLRRREIAKMYREKLSVLGSKIKFSDETADTLNSQHLFVVRVQDRNKVVNSLNDKGIGVGVHYKPNNHYKMYEQYVRELLPVTEKAYNELISLPMHLLLTDDDVETICKALIDSI